MALKPIFDMPRVGRGQRKEDVITLADRARDECQWERAAELYREALDRDHRNPPIWVQYGHALKESGELRDPDKLAQAEIAYRRALSLDPGGADTYLQLGHVLKLQGNIEGAQAAYLRAFALSPALPEPLHELGGLGWSETQLAELRALVGSTETDKSGTDSSAGASVAIPAQLCTTVTPLSQTRDLCARIEASGLFDPDVYLSLNDDLPRDGADAWEHFLDHGLNEGRCFTNCQIVARALAHIDSRLKRECLGFRAAARQAYAGGGRLMNASPLRRKGIRIGVFCSSEGNFFMHELADLIAWGLQAEGIAAVRRDEAANKNEPFELRVFVAPQEFFYLGRGQEWLNLASAPNSIVYNIDQPQSQWFCRVFPLLLSSSLVLDINFQSAAILRQAGCNVVHFQPGYLPTVPYVQPYVDISDVELVKGYDFAYQAYNWRERDDLDDRPIDILFVGSSVPRRDKALARLQELSDTFRFLCIYVRSDRPLTIRNYRHASSQIGCAIAQRAKIVLNIHRDWLGYFEWSRMVLQGIWQGACVVSEPNLPNPIFEAGEHYLEESGRHIGELIRWLLSTTEGRLKLNETRIRGYQQARGLGSMAVALAPVLDAFQQMLSP
jgi:tetratricopeptide (TPR) repeat protein